MSNGSGTTGSRFVQDGRIRWFSIISRVGSAFILLYFGAIARVHEAVFSAMAAINSWSYGVFARLIEESFGIHETLTLGAFEVAAADLEGIGLLSFGVAVAVAALYYRTIQEFVDNLRGGL